MRKEGTSRCSQKQYLYKRSRRWGTIFWVNLYSKKKKKYHLLYIKGRMAILNEKPLCKRKVKHNLIRKKEEEEEEPNLHV